MSLDYTTLESCKHTGGREVGDRELAEKVAKKLGWHEVNIFNKDRVFSWPTVGLAIEDARERGWVFETGHEGKTVYFFNYYHFHNDMTETYTIEEHGMVKAILLAYSEIPDE